MPRISHERKQYFKSRIRAVLSRDHTISGVELALCLKQEGLELERHYLGKLLKEIHAERINRADRQLLNTALAVFEDTITETMRIAWEIALDPFAERNEKLAAIREIREAHNDVFEKLFDAGVFDRKRGTLEVAIRNAPLPEEKKKLIREVFENWGILPAPKDGPASSS